MKNVLKIRLFGPFHKDKTLSQIFPAVNNFRVKYLRQGYFKNPSYKWIHCLLYHILLDIKQVRYKSFQVD